MFVYVLPGLFYYITLNLITMTNYERISYLKKIGVWDDIVVPLTAKLSTLDRFFKIYSYIKEHNVPKKRGNLPLILYSEEFVELFGNQYDINYIYQIIHIMEQNP